MAPNGCDTNQGTKTSPVQTLTRGCELARQQIKSKGYPAEGITIWVKGGNYSYAAPISLRQDFSGTPERAFRYEANARFQSMIEMSSECVTQITS